MAITEATPIMMPSIDKALRSLFAPKSRADFCIHFGSRRSAAQNGIFSQAGHNQARHGAIVAGGDGIAQRIGCACGTPSSFAAITQAAERLRNRLVRTYQPNTARNKLACLGAVMSWASRTGLLSTNPVLGLRPPSATTRLHFLSREEAVRLLEVAELKGKTSTRDAAFAVAVSLGIYGGLRAGEIWGLRWRDVNLSAALLTVSRSFDRQTTKSGTSRSIPMAPELATTLRRWKALCPETTEGLVCPCLNRNVWMLPKRSPSLTRFYEAAEIPVPEAPWHVLRHTFASLFMMSGGNLLTLQRLLGHADVKQTQVYAHLSSEYVTKEIKLLRLRG